MLLKVADLFVEVPATGGMSPRCGEYLTNESAVPDIIIRDSEYKSERWPGASPEMVAYMDSGFFFYRDLLAFGGMMLHSSAVELDGRAYLFSGPCGMGKSTHTRLWQSVFSDRAKIFNDDKPALRLIDGVWYAYGTPWSGKDGLNVNVKVPLEGICFLKRGEENRISRIGGVEAIAAVLSQTLRKFKDPKNTDRMLELVGRLISDIPIYEFYCTKDESAALVSYAAMCSDKKEEHP